MIPETYVARNILKRNWGISGDFTILSQGDNGCSWLCEADDGNYVLKAAPTAWYWKDETYHAWMDATRLCENAVTFWPVKRTDKPYRLCDGEWYWTVQTWVQGRQFNGTWEDAELVAKHMGIFTLALADPSQEWRLSERNLYANLTVSERVKVNDWLIANRFTPEWADVKVALEHLVSWYAEGLSLRPLPQKVITHYDMHPGNCIITPENVVFLDPTLAYGDPLQSLSFAASRFWPQDPMRFLVIAYGRQDDRVGQWRAYARREAILRINWILRVNMIHGANAWRKDLRKHIEYLEAA